MAEMKTFAKAEPESPGEAPHADRHGLLEHSREFLDFFWDIAKPQQETRLAATEKLLEYLRTRPTDSEMKYALKRLITGLGMGREAARPCYSLALAQLLQSFEDISLCSVLKQIQEKYDLQKVKKAMMRPALFANLFGVLALFQSGRLVKDQEALMKSVKMLKVLTQHYNHLQGQPLKAIVDILSEVPETMFEEILPKVLRGDLKVVLSSPKHLELFLLAQRRVPAKLESLMGTVDLFSDENIPSLVNVLKMAATSVKKEHKLPDLALDLLRLALKEDKFPLFWKEVVEQGMLKKPCWASSYLCFRLLGASLPLLSEDQLQLVMRGELIRHFGEHMVIAKPQNLFKFIPEMSDYVGTFLEGCRDDPERQLSMLVAFSSITNQGLPVMPTFWRVTRFLNAEALQRYVAWLQEMFLRPSLDSLVDFSTTNQKKAQDASFNVPERAAFRLRKWIMHRLVSLVDHLHLQMDEALVEQVARFCLFHAFFKTKKATPQIPETKQLFSFPLDNRIQEVTISAFFSLLQTLGAKFRRTDQAEGWQPWTYRLVQFADMLLNHSRNITIVTPFTKQQRQAWDQMLKTLKELETSSSETKATAFQHLLLLVGLHLFKSPTESCDLLDDIQTCIKKSMEQKPRRSRSKANTSQEPPWVEVMVEILLSLLTQPSHLIRQVARNVFGHICSHLTPRALQLILAVLNPETNEDEDENVVVTDDSSEKQPKHAEEDEGSDSEDSKNSESDMDSEGAEESEEEDRDEDVDPGFRQQLMAVLQAGNALGGEDSEDDEELGDEAMMALDQNLASLFAEQKLRIQARREEKNKLQKEKSLRRDFQIRVLDLIEVLVTKQPKNPLVLDLLEPLLNIIRRCSGSSKQEQDLLHKTARIFMHHLCRARHYCHKVEPCAEALHAQVERLVQQASSQANTSVALYYFNASLYLLRVLKGNTSRKYQEIQKQQEAGTKPEPTDSEAQTTNCLDLNFVTRVYSAALESFLTKRNSPLTVPMFLSLFSRYPVICKSLLPVLVLHVAGPSRPRHQAQTCLLLQQTLPARELRVCFEDPEWEQLIGQVLAKVTQTLYNLGEAQSKAEHQKELSSLELLNTLFKIVNHEKLTVDFTALLGVLQGQQQKLQQSLQQGNHSSGSSRLYDLYWQAMKMLGVQRPRSEKKDSQDAPSVTQSPISMKRKKKGFLPETKKRKKRKSEDATLEQDVMPENAMHAATGGDQPPSTGKKKRNVKKMKAQAQAQVNGTPAAKSPAPNNLTLSPSTPAKTPKLQKKKEKLSQVSGATPVSPIEPEDKNQHQKAVPRKEVVSKSPQSALPRKKARLSLVSRSPSLLQSGARKRKVARRKEQTP